MGSFNDMANDPLAVKRPHFELPGHLKLNNEKETPDFLKSAEPSNHGEEDAQMLELRSYFERMDKFSMGTLVVWQGKVMEDSPEFKEFKRSNAHKWGAICVVLRALEEMAGMYGIKMAVVDCAKVVECALLALSHYYPETLLSCITNRSTVEMQMRSLRNSTGANQHLRAAILFQTLLRRWTAQRYVKELKLRVDSAKRIQNCYRFYFQRKGLAGLRQKHQEDMAVIWEKNKKLAQENWQNADNPSLFIIIPNFTFSDDVEEGAKSHTQEMHNTIIPFLHLLTDPKVHLIVVTPFPIGHLEMKRYQSYINAVGIPRSIDLATVFHVFSPERQPNYPPNLSVAKVLWFSSRGPQLLRRQIRKHLQHGASSYILPVGPDYVHQRLSIYLDVPLLSIEWEEMKTLSCNSFSKRIISKSGVNCATTVHDVSSREDLVTALVNLIAANLKVERWTIRLNGDTNENGFAFLEVKDLELVETLRHEFNMVVKLNDHNIGAWYSRPVQLAARKRLTEPMETRLEEILQVSHPSYLRGSSKEFLHQAMHQGCLVEEATFTSLGFVQSTCFIDPLGGPWYLGASDLILDHHQRRQGYMNPSQLAVPDALEGATFAIARTLWYDHHYSGFFSVTFCSFYDIASGMPRLWGHNLAYGLPLSIIGAGALGAIAAKQGRSLPELSAGAGAGQGGSEPAPASSFVFEPKPQSGRSVIYLPLLCHGRLSAITDEYFYKTCLSNGITYKESEGTGSLFLQLGPVSCGAMGCLFVGRSPEEAVRVGMRTLETLSRTIGKDKFEASSVETLSIMDTGSIDETGTGLGHDGEQPNTNPAGAESSADQGSVKIGDGDDQSQVSVNQLSITDREFIAVWPQAHTYNVLHSLKFLQVMLLRMMNVDLPGIDFGVDPEKELEEQILAEMIAKAEAGEDEQAELRMMLEEEEEQGEENSQESSTESDSDSESESETTESKGESKG
jgi:hypothetical protein